MTSDEKCYHKAMSRPYKPRPQHFDSPKLCGEKRRYRTRHDAEMVIAEKEIMQPELELTVYRCTQCGDFHLTRTSS